MVRLSMDGRLLGRLVVDKDYAFQDMIWTLMSYAPTRLTSLLILSLLSLEICWSSLETPSMGEVPILVSKVLPIQVRSMILNFLFPALGSTTHPIPPMEL